MARLKTGLWWLGGVLATGALLFIAWVLLVGITVDATGWRDPIASALSKNLNREVWLRGDVRIHLGMRPALQLSRLHVRNTNQHGVVHGFADIDWLYVGQVDVQFDARHYLAHGDLRFRRISADNVAVFLQANQSGANNWTEAPAVSLSKASDKADRADDPQRPDPQTPPPHPFATLSQLAVDDIRIKRLHVEYQGPDDSLRMFTVPLLTGRAPAGGPVSARFRGVVDSLFPFDVEFTGGPLQDLVDRAQGWPMTVVTNALGTTMTLDGSVRPDTTTLQFGWGTPDPLQAGQILHLKLPDVGPTALAAQITILPDRVRLENLRGWMGVTRMSGDITVHTDRERPLIAGNLAVPVLDLKPFMQGELDDAGVAQGAANRASEPSVQSTADNPARGDTTPASDNGGASVAQWYRERAASVLDLSALDQVDADLKLSVGQWLSLPGNVRNASLHVMLVDGRLTAPVQAELAGVAMQGNVDIAGGSQTPKIEIALGAVDTPLGELAQFLFGLRGVRGQLHSVAFRLEGSGRRVADQVNAMRVYLAMSGGALTYGNQAGQQPVAFGLDQLVVDIEPGQPMNLTASGSLLDQPIAIQFAGAPLASLLSEGETRIDLRAQSGSAQARIRGSAGQRGSDGSLSTRLFVGVSAREARDVAAWFGFNPTVKAPFSMAGQLFWDGTNWTVRDGRLGVGRNGIRADIEQLSGSTHPLVRANIVADRLNVEQLQALFGDGDSKGPPVDNPSLLHIPVLPADIDLTDTDLNLRIKHLVRPGLDIRNLRFDATIREGRMLPSPLSMTLLRVPMSGAVALDLRSNKPRGQWWLAANNVDIGRLMRRMKIADNIDARADLLSMHLELRGNTLGEVLRSSNLTLEISGGALALRDRNTGAAARFVIDTATARAPAGRELQAQVRGRWNSEPMKLSLGTAPAVEFLRTSKPVPFNAQLEVADTDFEVFGKVGREFGSTGPAGSGNASSRRASAKDRELKLNMLVSGKQLSSLNRLSGVDLPPWGPYEMNGVVILSDDGYEVPNLSLRVADSQLDGTGVVLTTESPPRVDVLLNAAQLQMNDFRFGNWSPTGGDDKAAPESTDDDNAALDTEAVRRQARQASEQTQSLLSEQTLRLFNGGVRLTVNEIRSGKDRLGSGSMRLNVYDGVAAIGPITLQLPDSSASLKINYAPDANGIDMRTQIKANQLDYGFLARRIDSESEIAGRLSLDVDVSAATPRLSDAMEYSSGEIGFDIWPEDVKANVFDLWATNLFLALATRLDPSSASKINCAIGRFDLNDGLLSHKKIVIDTTRVRVAGQGSVDFKTEAVRLRMEPLPKKAEFFSLATPIVVDGTVDDYAIGAGAGDIAATAVRLATSLLWVPMRKLFGRASPANGSDICGDPGRFLARVDQTRPQRQAIAPGAAAKSGSPAPVAQKTDTAKLPATAAGSTPEAVKAPAPSGDSHAPTGNDLPSWHNSDDDPYIF